MTVDLRPAEAAVFGDERMRAVEAHCLCPTCPAYPQEDRGKKLAYCLRGASDHKDKIDPKDCLCESCEIYKHGRLYGQNFYCLTGVAVAKGGRNVLTGHLIDALLDQKHRLHPTLFVSAGLDVRRRTKDPREDEEM